MRKTIITCDRCKEEWDYDSALRNVWKGKIVEEEGFPEMELELCWDCYGKFEAFKRGYIAAWREAVDAFLNKVHLA